MGRISSSQSLNMIGFNIDINITIISYSRAIEICIYATLQKNKHFCWFIHEMFAHYSHEIIIWKANCQEYSWNIKFKNRFLKKYGIIQKQKNNFQRKLYLQATNIAADKKFNISTQKHNMQKQPICFHINHQITKDKWMMHIYISVNHFFF